MAVEVFGDKRVLVTTALEETFPKDKNEKILFLGEWCKLYSDKDIYEQYEYEVLPYHWDDREKLYDDTKYIDKVYEKYLELLKENLNKIHSVKFSISYWRIILGPWLRYFTEMVYDRYLSIEEVSLRDDIDYTNILNIQPEEIIPNNMAEFNKLFISDVWNQFIYQNIIIYFDIRTESSNVVSSEKTIEEDDKKSLKQKIINNLFFLNKFNSIHFLSSYIKLKNLIPLQITLGQLPTLGVSTDVVFNVNYSIDMRDLLEFPKNQSLFENILSDLVKKQIPKYYLEGYTDFRKKVLNAYPKKSKIIFTANAYSSNDSFKFWVAEKHEQGTQYIIGQHGGHYGMGLFSSHEKHQIKSADKFFSWGWDMPQNNKVVPVSAIKLNQNIKHNPKGDILIPFLSIPRYSYHVMSMVIAGQMLKYFDNQIELLKFLSPELKPLIKLRLTVSDYQWNFKDRLTDEGFANQIDSDKSLKKSFYNRLSECRLCIATYNATTYLETFSANFPTLLYWDSYYWELNNESKPYFKLLEDEGILHYSVESLYEKLNEIYMDPMSWWKQKNIQDAKDIFCKRFANREKNYVLDYKSKLN